MQTSHFTALRYSSLLTILKRVGEIVQRKGVCRSHCQHGSPRPVVAGQNSLTQVVLRPPHTGCGVCSHNT